MKKLVLTIWVGAGLLSAQGQLFSPESWTGAFWGSLIGGIAGSDCHHGFSGNGAAIGAGIGFLTGALVGEARRQSYYHSDAAYYYPYAPSPYAYPVYGANPYPPVYYSRPNYAVDGTLLGAASGALIGAGTHHPGEGAAIGAATGLVLGSVAEVSARHHEASPATPPVTTTVPKPRVRRAAPRAVTQPAAVQTGAVHQIADAPRVPDPPMF